LRDLALDLRDLIIFPRWCGPLKSSKQVNLSVVNFDAELVEGPGVWVSEGENACLYSANPLCIGILAAQEFSCGVATQDKVDWAK
jgi:hypothetical protein